MAREPSAASAIAWIVPAARGRPPSVSASPASPQLMAMMSAACQRFRTRGAASPSSVRRVAMAKASPAAPPMATPSSPPPTSRSRPTSAARPQRASHWTAAPTRPPPSAPADVRARARCEGAAASANARPAPTPAPPSAPQPAPITARTGAMAIGAVLPGVAARASPPTPPAAIPARAPPAEAPVHPVAANRAARRNRSHSGSSVSTGGADRCSRLGASATRRRPLPRSPRDGRTGSRGARRCG